MQRDQRGDHRVHDAFGDFRAIRQQDRRVGHQVADIAHQHQRARAHHFFRAVRAGVGVIWVQRAGDCFVALLHFFGEIAFHQAEPVAVGFDLVLGVHCGDGVFEVHDGGQGGFEDHIGDAGRVG